MVANSLPAIVRASSYGPIFGKGDIQTYRHTDQHAVLVVHLFFNLSFLRCGLVDFVTSSCRLKALQMLRWDTGLLTCRLCFHFFFLPTDLFFLFLLTNPKQGSAFDSTREKKGWPCMSTVSFDLWFIVFFLFFSCLVCGEGEGRVAFCTHSLLLLSRWTPDVSVPIGEWLIYNYRQTH